MEGKKVDKDRGTGELAPGLLALEDTVNMKHGNHLINSIHSSVKAAQLYDENNEGFISQIDKLMGTLSSLFESEHIVSLEVYMNYLFFNRVKIRTDFQNYIHVRFIIEALKRRNTEGLFFRPDLSFEELSNFTRLLARKEDQQEISCEEFQEQLSDLNIQNILPQQFSSATKREAEERLLGIRRQAKRTFFESIYNLKGIVFKSKSERRTGARRVRRLVQSIVDLIAEDEPYLIGLTTMKHYDEYILNHSVNVCVLSVALGQRLGLERNALKEIGLAGMFHDIGKMPNPSEIHSKDSLSPEEERDLIERHPHYGVEMLMQMKGLGELPVRAMKAILEHHLNADQSGYPSLSERKEQDLFSRIIAITDHFDVRTTPTTFQPQPKTPDQVLTEMWEERGKIFDPIILELFISVIGIYPVGSLVTLDTGEVGVVIQPHVDSAMLDRPMVTLISDRHGEKIDGKIVDLTETESRTGTFLRTIVKCLDPLKYNVNISKIVAQ